jgi:hypothetical protein
MISPPALIPTPHCGPLALRNSISRRFALTSLASVIRIATPHEMVLVEGMARVRFCEVLGLLKKACPSPNLPVMRLVLEVLLTVHRPATPVTPVVAG